MALSCRDPSITEEHQIQLFTSGLNKPLRTNVTLQRPVTLDEAIMFAQAYEQRNTPPAQTIAAPTSARSSSRLLSKAPSAPTPSTANSVGFSGGSINKPTTTLKLTPAAIVEWLKIGQCFHCNDMYTDGHHDVCKQLFVIEVLAATNDQAPTTGTEDLTISLHTLIGIRPQSGCTMQLAVDINGARLNALLDSGSTHNGAQHSLA
jgi:hypothetical protein